MPCSEYTLVAPRDPDLEVGATARNHESPFTPCQVLMRIIVLVIHTMDPHYMIPLAIHIFKFDMKFVKDIQIFRMLREQFVRYLMGPCTC